MKRSQLLAATVVALMVLSAFPAQQALAASSYTEKLNVYVAGSDALWFMTFGGVNGSSSLSALESTPGLSWYNVTAIQTSGWSSDFQVFGAQGYNLLPVPFIPSQGLFLTVGADSYAHAAAAASALDSYLLTSFTSLSNGTGTYAFYSPVSFNNLMPSTLLSFLPSGEGGFANAVSPSSFMSLASPFIVLEGVRSSSGFVHSLVLGSMTSGALSSSQPALMNYFGSSPKSLTASNHSSSSVVQVNVLDGEVASSDKGSVVRNMSNFTGSYSLTLAPGKSISGVNATVSQQPPPLLATRTVDVGVLKNGDNLAVTLAFKDLSTSESISSLSFTDNWWNGTGEFKFLGGSDSVSNGGVGAGASVTPVYRIEYIGNATGPLVIPASVVRYQYTVNGAKFNATAVLNPVRLSLGADDAVVVATMAPNGSLGKPVGESQTLNITVTNVGTLPASSVVVAGQSVPGLAARGGSATVTVSQSNLGLLGINASRSYSVSYQDPAGTSLGAATNVVSDVFSHSGMSVGSPTLTATARVSTLASKATNVTLTFTTTNSGPANVTSFKATEALPPGLGCGTAVGTGLACAAGVITLSYPTINASSSLTAYMKFNLTSPLNYVLAPFDFQGTSSGLTIAGRSNAVAVPAGMVVSKQFAPSQLFGGMKSSVLLAASNGGPLPAYNATVSSTADSFDIATGGSVLSKGATTLASGGNLSLSYQVTVDQVSGAESGSVATVSFYFGATPFSVSSPAPTLEVYQTLGASVTTTPATPEEGKNFTINIVITNPSAVQVSNVTMTLPVPAGLGLSGLVNARVSSGLLTVTASSLAPGATIGASASAVASSGITVPFRDAKLTFSYGGVTIHGRVPSSSGIGIAEDVLTRYIVPTGFILIAVFAVAFYVRRKAATVPASPK